MCVLCVEHGLCAIPPRRLTESRSEGGSGHIAVGEGGRAARPSDGILQNARMAFLVVLLIWLDLGAVSSFERARMKIE